MDGILIINKPKKYTSHDIVNIARKALNTKRVGHIGTLDPNATGVLVLCVNKATKLVKYFESHSKTYIATIKLGVKTDSDDITGEVIASKDASNIKEKDIIEVLNSFAGKQKQIPPNYSAVKVNGKKLYELARRDIVIHDISPRDVEVHEISDFEILEKSETITFRVTLKVSKGTYIRSIARDMGEILGCYGTLAELERTAIDNFKIADAFTLEEILAEKYEILDPFKYLNMPKIVVDPLYKSYINNGRFLDLDMFPEKTDTIIYSKDKEVLAIYYYDEQKNTMRMSVKWC
ncbi:tRNA pseudouridine(55) synthase TruB [Mycoplasmatota bacterium WC30]